MPTLVNAAVPTDLRSFLPLLGRARTAETTQQTFDSFMRFLFGNAKTWSQFAANNNILVSPETSGLPQLSDFPLALSPPPSTWSWLD